MSNDIAEPSSALPPPVAATKKSFLERIAGVLFAPAETFEDIARKPDILAPLLLIVIIGYVTTALVVPKLDMESMIATQGETMKKQNPNLTDADLERVGKFMRATVTVSAWLGPILVLIGIVIVAAVLFFAHRMFGGSGTFGQAFSVSLYSWLPRVFLSVVMTIVVMAKGTFDPTTAATIVKSNPAFLVSMKEQPVLFSFLSSFDLFTIWTIVLLIIGFSVLSRSSRVKSAAIVISLWLVAIVVKVGFAALGAARMKG